MATPVPPAQFTSHKKTSSTKAKNNDILIKLDSELKDQHAAQFLSAIEKYKSYRHPWIYHFSPLHNKESVNAQIKYIVCYSIEPRGVVYGLLPQQPRHTFLL
jgi:hypothetical protein